MSKERKLNASLLAQASSMGFVFVFSIVGFAAIGYFIDIKAGTLPAFLFTGFVLGVVGAFYTVFRLVSRLSKALDDDSKKK